MDNMKKVARPGHRFFFRNEKDGDSEGQHSGDECDAKWSNLLPCY
jgi:hypothetical protein